MRKILFTLIVCLFVIGSKAQVELYGLTYEGGDLGSSFNGFGTIFHYNLSTSTYTLDYSLEGGNNGANPLGNLTFYNGKLYGMTYRGGVNDYGTIFEWNPSTNVFTKKIDFNADNGKWPIGSLIISNGKFYGMTQVGGANNQGVIFEWNPETNICIKKIDFNGINGELPSGNLIFNSGKFYGMTPDGGVNGAGVIFEWDPTTNIYIKKIDFDIVNGDGPHGSLIYSNGKFYGMTTHGGLHSNGVIFEWDVATNIYAKKIDFDGPNGDDPYGSLTFYNGKFYGMTYSVDENEGAIFDWDPITNIYTKRVEFNYTNGSSPKGSLILYGTKFYGMTQFGGLNYYGVVFEWDPVNNSLSTLVNFNKTNGSLPQGDLLAFDPIALPALYIADKLFIEGNSDTNQMRFKVTLNSPSANQITVKYATENVSALAGSDYTPTNGRLKFNPGETSKTITVFVNGDTQIEANEKFKVLLSKPVNATIADSIGVGTIKNDDPSFFATDNISDDSKKNAAGLVLQVSPNPAKSKINVSGLATGIENYIELRDMSGRSLLKQKVRGSVQTIDLAKYAEGIYVLRYFNGSNWQQIKVVKQ